MMEESGPRPSLVVVVGFEKQRRWDILKSIKKEQLLKPMINRSVWDSDEFRGLNPLP